MKMLKYYFNVARWMWKHREEHNCRQKWRRMEREINAAGAERRTE